MMGKTVLVTRAQIAAAGGVKAVLDEALSLAALQMTPRAITAYEAVGMVPADADGMAFTVIVEVENEAELREAVEAGAEAVRLLIVDATEARRLEGVGRELRGDLKVERD
jgi:hypothetical protein